MEIQTFTAESRKATLYRSEKPDLPLIVLNVFSGDGSSVFEAMEETSAPDCNLLVVGGLRWDHDMTPWYCPPITKKDTPCTGGADEYLDLLLSDILPGAKALLNGEPSFTGIAGYSLAGLFALYAAYRCGAFSRVASMSGSLWFPGFPEYVTGREMQRRPDKIYLSLGDKEAVTKNMFLKTVRANTEAIAAHYQQLGLNVVWELNPGNHFADAAARSAKGIASILQ